jgi:transcriptional regulator with XRE-family HTH domain
MVCGMDQITARIEALRLARGLSETQLATASAISRMTFRRRLVDPTSFTVSELERVAAALGTTAAHLAGYGKTAASA